MLCALPAELGEIGANPRGSVQRQGVELLQVGPMGAPENEVQACICGVGKVAAAQAATLLVEAGAERLLVVGSCGALRRGMPLGSLLHASHAVAADFALREGREFTADESLLRAWRDVAPGLVGWHVTADRPVISPWRRLRLGRAFAGPCAADMETAAVAAVAQRAGVPWAALRVVTDGVQLASMGSFAKNLARYGGIPAGSLSDLLRRLQS